MNIVVVVVVVVVVSAVVVATRCTSDGRVPRNEGESYEIRR